MNRRVFKLDYGPRDTTLERLASLAQEHDVSLEMLAKRFIERALGDYGLKTLTDDDFEQAADLRDLFVRAGLERKS